MKKDTKLPMILGILALVIALAITPMFTGLMHYHVQEYGEAVKLLKFYPFVRNPYLDAAEKEGDACFAAGEYHRAITYYNQLGDAGTLPLAKVYCAIARDQLSTGASLSQFLNTLSNITETPETIPLRDQVILEGAQHYLGENNLEGAIELLTHVVSADVSPVQKQINTVYIREALGVLEAVDATADYALDEPKAFALLRTAMEALKQCDDSALGIVLTTAMEDLLVSDPDSFVATMEQLVALADSEPAAGEAAWAMWRCFSHLLSAKNHFFVDYQPYDAMDMVLTVGGYAAQIADPAQAAQGSTLDAIAALAKDGDVRRWEKGLFLDDSRLDLRLDKLGKAAGNQPKLLFIRNYLPINVAPQEYCMTFGIDLEMMALLPQEYWPSGWDDVTHIVSLHYFHEEVGEYFDTSNPLSNMGFGGSPAIQDSAHIRIYSVPSGKILYQSQVITGPKPPASVSSDQIKDGYCSGGDIDLSEQLKDALQKTFPDLK